MLQNIKSKREEGFTIIEVLIVLAIAGLIMVVVFLAVPALQRNSHNQQYKTEADNLMTAYHELSNNNGGTALTSSDVGAIKSAANVKTLSDISFAAAGTKTAQTPALGAGIFITGVKCASQISNKPTDEGAVARDVVLIYQIESSGSDATYQCLDS